MRVIVNVKGTSEMTCKGSVWYCVCVVSVDVCLVGVCGGWVGDGWDMNTSDKARSILLRVRCKLSKSAPTCNERQ